MSSLRTLLLMAAASLPAATVAGTWSTRSITWLGVDRSYHMYHPGSALVEGAGLMVFIHGHGMGGDGSLSYWTDDGEALAEWHIADNADSNGFIALAAIGMPDPYVGGHAFEIDNRNDDNEVGYIHAIVADATADAEQTGPNLALGFSNGAGLAQLMGCANLDDLYVAHVGVIIDPDSDYPTTCTPATSMDLFMNNMTRAYHAIGENDFFLTGQGNSGSVRIQSVRDQFVAMHTASDCPNGDETYETVEEGNCYDCYVYPSCPELGMLCTYYEGLGHQIVPSMTASAYAFLTNSTNTFDYANEVCPAGVMAMEEFVMYGVIIGVCCVLCCLGCVAGIICYCRRMRKG